MSLTFFANERVISVIRVVRITRRGASSIAEGTKVKFYTVSVSYYQYTERDSYLETHVQTAQSDLSCWLLAAEETWAIVCALLVSEVEWFVGVRHAVRQRTR